RAAGGCFTGERGASDTCWPRLSATLGANRGLTAPARRFCAGWRSRFPVAPLECPLDVIRPGEQTVAVRIRMKQMGRTHRHYYRIVAIDHHQPRDGRAIEELGSYDPHVKNKDERVKLVPSRIKYWQSVGALPSEHCAAIFKKFMKKWE